MQSAVVKGDPQRACLVIEGLFQFYAHDFSEFAAPDSTAFDFNEEGRFFEYPHMASYWCGADRWPLVIRVDGRTAGFALVNTLSHCGETIDRESREPQILCRCPFLLATGPARRRCARPNR